VLLAIVRVLTPSPPCTSRAAASAATLSTTTNSNNINVIVGLLPAALLGLGTVTGDDPHRVVVPRTHHLVLAWMFLRRGLDASRASSSQRTLLRRPTPPGERALDAFLLA
jgi:hypothetical protein